MSKEWKASGRPELVKKIQLDMSGQLIGEPEPKPEPEPAEEVLPEFQVLATNYADEMTEEINQWYNKGYHRDGEMCITHTGSNCVYAQIMRKDNTMNVDMMGLVDVYSDE